MDGGGTNNDRLGRTDSDWLDASVISDLLLGGDVEVL